MILLITLLAAFVVWYTLYRITNARRFELAAKFPGPRTIPLFGNALIYMKKKPEDILPYMHEFQQKYGRLFRVWIGPYQLAFFSTDAKDLEIVLSSQRLIKKNNLYNFLIPWLGTGLLLSDGSKWHTRRKIITPTFHFKILEQFVEVFDKQSNIMIEMMKKKIASDGSAFNVYPFINLCALDVISESAMGIQLNSQTDSESEYVKAVANISEIMAFRFVRVWQRSDFIFNNFVSTKALHDKSIMIMHEFTEDIIKQRRQKLIASQQNETGNTTKPASSTTLSDDENVGSKNRMALLDVLLQATVDGKPLSDKDIREEVDTFMFEGHDTTTSGMCFTLYCISKHPDIQKKLYDEIKDVVGEDTETRVTYRHLQDLKYMELVIKETLRLYPPVPIVGRRFEEEVNLNGKIIPAHSNFSIGISIIGKDPEYFPEPDKFIPERYSLETTNPFAYIPFSAGPRNCIGQKFAMLEIKSLISKILRHYEVVETGPDPIIVVEIVLRSKNGIHIGLKPRIK